jgi:hypothetical protein
MAGVADLRNKARNDGGHGEGGNIKLPVGGSSVRGGWSGFGVMSTPGWDGGYGGKNTGGGGGAATTNGGTPGTGGSGIVIIRYVK